MSLFLAMVVTLLGCDIKPPKPPIVWIIALDITTTVPNKHFRTMRDEMIPRIVLSRLRGRDEVHVLLVDSDPEDNVAVIPVSGRRVSLDKEIAGIFVDHIQKIEQPPRYRGLTNIGGVLAYAKRAAQVLHTDRAEVGGKSRASRVVVMVFTDGKLEGRQPGYGGEWPDDVQVWFWGIGGVYEEPLKKWATKEMGLPEEQVTIVRFSDWETMADVFGRKIDRPFQDPNVLQGLQSVRQSPAGDKRLS